MDRYVKSNKDTGASSASPPVQKLVSFWDLMGAERKDNPENMLKLKAQLVMQSRTLQEQEANDGSESKRSQIVEVDLTAESPSESPEVSVIGGKRINHKSRYDKFRRAEQIEDASLSNLTKLFDRNLLAELITEDTWMDRLRREIERNDLHSFELMRPYRNPLWHQFSVVDDCILVDNRLVVPGQLRQAVLKRIHRDHPGEEAMLDVSRYLWWPHMHKDIVNLAEECRGCTRYGKNAKYIIPKNASKPLSLLTQLGHEIQLDYAGTLEDKKGKKYTGWSQ